MDFDNRHIINYRPLPTIREFHRDNSLVRGLMGPLGSGKSTGCCYELMRRILQHPVNPKTGLRESVALVVRNTYRELKDTSIRTWLKLFPEDKFGRFHYSDMVHKVRVKGVKADVLFRALDRPGDEAKLLSLEVTFIFVNEAREINYRIIQMLPRRLRYPAASDYPDCFRGIIMDTNPPDTDHWWYKVFEEQKPANWRLFRQPSGISAAAENLANLPLGYYTTQMTGASADWLKIYRDGDYGYVGDLRAVYPEYDDRRHCRSIKIDKKLPLIVGLDFGRTPAAVFTQHDKSGRWLVYDELATYDIGAMEFAKILRAKVKRDFADFQPRYYGDPAGNQKSQTDSNTVYTSLAAGGINAMAAPSNSQILRKEVLRRKLAESITRQPAFLIDPKCRILRKGLLGGYCYRRLKVSGDERYMDKPEKNQYSHLVEALEYAMLGGGEDIALNKLAKLTWERDNRLPPKVKLRRQIY